MLPGEPTNTFINSNGNSALNQHYQFEQIFGIKEQPNSNTKNNLFQKVKSNKNEEYRKSSNMEKSKMYYKSVNTIVCVISENCSKKQDQPKISP